MKQQFGNSSGVVMCNEFLLGEILSRLPVKPLMRFKCVCKQWQSLIHKDRSFIDLHFTRSKTSEFSVGDDGGGGISLFIRWPTWHSFDFSSVELIVSEGRLETIQREVHRPGASFVTHVFGAVNGLISLLNSQIHSVRIFNPSTGQSTPWIQSMIKQKHPNLYEEIQVIDEHGEYVARDIQYVNCNWYYFGYDPVTMEHKVVCIWKKMIYKRHGGFLRFENICEIMTVDGRQHNNNNLTWRKINDEFSLPPTISLEEFASSLSANGSIYWMCTGEEPLVVEFNVGSEKFRVISIPNNFFNFIKESCDTYACKLIQIDGRLALLVKTTMKMCVLYDKKLKDNISSTLTSASSAAGSTVGNCGDFYWTEETFLIPIFGWSHLMLESIQAVPGTDLLIIRSWEEDGSNFYFYDWRKKSLSKKDEHIFVVKTKLQPYSFEYFVYKESLLPVI